MGMAASGTTTTQDTVESSTPLTSSQTSIAARALVALTGMASAVTQATDGLTVTEMAATGMSAGNTPVATMTPTTSRPTNTAALAVLVLKATAPGTPRTSETSVATAVTGMKVTTRAGAASGMTKISKLPTAANAIRIATTGTRCNSRLRSL